MLLYIDYNADHGTGLFCSMVTLQIELRYSAIPVQSKKRVHTVV